MCLAIAIQSIQFVQAHAWPWCVYTVMSPDSVPLLCSFFLIHIKSVETRHSKVTRVWRLHVVYRSLVSSYTTGGINKRFIAILYKNFCKTFPTSLTHTLLSRRIISIKFRYNRSKKNEEKSESPYKRNTNNTSDCSHVLC